MARCENGHDVPEGQKFCGRCGMPATSTEPVDTSVEETDDPIVEPGPQTAVNSRAAGVRDMFSTRQWAAITVGGAIFIVLMVVLATQSGGGDHQADTVDIPIVTTVPPSAPDLCVSDLDQILVDATQPGSTQDSTSRDVMAVYGVQDERTQFLLLENATFQGEVFQVGTDTANAQSQDRVRAYCEQNAERLGY